MTFAGEQAQLLEASRAVAKMLIEHHCAYHRELINSQRDLPHVYSKGDVIFSRRSVKSDKEHGVVAKVKHPYTGTWTIVESLPGSSYEIEHIFTGERSKRHHR